jgi:hypothetical protein
MIGNTSNHHRYGEVKTRLTIGARSDFTAFHPWTIFLEKPCQKRSERADVTILQAGHTAVCNQTAYGAKPSQPNSRR